MVNSKILEGDRKFVASCVTQPRFLQLPTVLYQHYKQQTVTS